MRLGLLGLCAVAATAAHAQRFDPERPLLRMDWRQGESFAFRVKEIAHEPELGDQEKAWTETLTVAERAGERIVLDVTRDDETRRLTCGRRGEVYNAKLAPTSWFRLPEERVTPGTEWVSFDDEFATPFGICERTNICTFRGITTLAGRPIAKLVMRSTVMGRNISGGGTGYASVDARYGRLISLTFHYVLTINQNGARRTVPVTLEVRRAE